MPFAGFEVNPGVADPWMIGIGKFIVNFGSLEWTTYLWIKALSKDEVIYDLSMNMPLAKRIDLIDQLISRLSGDERAKKRSREIWSKVRKLSKIRNDLAHNPITFGWRGPQENRPPDFVGSFNIRKTIESKNSIAPLIELKTLHKAIDQVVAHVTELEKLLSEFQNSANAL